MNGYWKKIWSIFHGISYPFSENPNVNKQTNNLKTWLVDIIYSQVRQNEELWVVCLLLFKKYENDKPIREY